MPVAWEAVTALAEAIGALGVIASVVYLAREIWVNTRTMRADSSSRAQLTWSECNFKISEHPHREAIVKCFDPERRLEHLADDERVTLTFTMRAFAQWVEARFYQFRARVLEPEVWRAHRTSFAGLLQFPVLAAWWAEEKTMPLDTRSFKEAIASVGKVELSYRVAFGADAAPPPGETV